tara:strand:+ start:550 stop:882 length:333 start_codon:yes stop_codon:yes gene_type:complete
MVLAQVEAMAAQEPTHILRGLQQLLQVTEVFIVEGVEDQDTKTLVITAMVAQAVEEMEALMLMLLLLVTQTLEEVAVLVVVVQEHIHPKQVVQVLSLFGMTEVRQLPEEQ